MRFNHIQILKFFAAAGVLLYHAHFYVGEWVWTTPLTRFFDVRFAWGVELFFVISGFVVSHSLTQSTPGRFLLCRLLRIYPGFWLAAALVIAATLASGGGRPFPDGMLPALTLLPVGGADYPLGGVEWSLVYGIFFYVLIAAVALVPARNAREWAMFGWGAAIAAWALWGPVRATSLTPTLGLLPFSAFNLAFIAGVLAYSWFRSGSKLPIAALVLTIPFTLIASDFAPYTEIALALRAIAFASLVLLAAQLSRVRDAAPESPLVRLGDASFGLYLIHVPVIKALLAGANFGPSGANAAFVSVVGTALLAGVAYGFIEPALYRRNRRRLLVWLTAPAAASATPQSTARRSTSQRFNNIQILRFVAALLVLVGHSVMAVGFVVPEVGNTNMVQRFGGWGVFLFFSISGFVLTHTAQQQTAGEFIMHRVLRIYPAFFLAAAIVFVAKYILFASPIPESQLSWRALSLLPFGDIGYPLWIEWSLVYEVFFYAVLAVLWIPRSNRFLIACCGVWLAAIAVATIARPGWATVRLPTIYQIAVSPFNLAFIFGILAYFLLPKLGSTARRFLLPIALTSGLATPLVIWNQELLVFVWSIAAVAFVLFAAALSRTNDAASTSWWVRGGDYSYGLYLLHLSVIMTTLVVVGAKFASPWMLMAGLGAFALTIGLLYGRFESRMYRRLKSAIRQREQEGASAAVRA